jgi:hypothetical protein
MSLKQFPASQSTASKARKVLPPRMNATLFDPIRAWDVINKRKEEMHEHVDVGGFGAVGRNAAEQIANAAGIRISKGFSIHKAVDVFRRSKFREMRAYAIFLLLFTVSTYYHRDFGQGNILRSSFQTVLLKMKYLASESQEFITFQDIDTVDDFWDYLKHGLFSNLLLSGDPSIDFEGSSSFHGLHYAMKYNRIIQPIRIRQLRVNSLRVESCDVAVDMVVAGVDFRCWPSYSEQNENRSAIQGFPAGKSIQYSSGESLRTDSYGKGATATYSGGGFVLDIPVGSSRESIAELLNYLKREHWIDFATRAVFIDLCTYNPSTQFFTSVRLLFEFLPYGDVRSSNSILVMKGSALPSNFEDSVLYYMDIAVYSLLVLFVFWDMKRVMNVGWLHLQSVWNWVGVLNYTIFTYTFVERLVYLNLEPVRAFASTLTSDGTMQEVYDFHTVGERYKYISVLIGFSAFLCWIRILSYFRYFDRDLSILVSTIGNCAKDTYAWFLTMAIVIFAYAQAFFLAFGPEVDGFDTIGQSLGTLCQWLFHRVNTSDIIGIDQ